MANVESGVWRASSCPFVIQCAPEVLEQINAKVIEGFYAFRRGGLEVGGILFGRRFDGGMEVLASVPLVCQYAQGPGFRLSAADRAGVEHVFRTWRSRPQLTGMSPLGFYRSVTRRDIGLDAEDAALFEAYLPSAQSIVLVLRPDAISPTQANFFFMGERGWETDVSAELTLGMGRPSRQDPPPPAPEPVRPPEPVPAAGELDVQAAPLPDLWLLPQPSPKRRGWWISIAALLIAAIAGGAAGWWFYLREPALGLSLESNAGQMRVKWDRRAAETMGARRAWVEIRDGATRIVTEFTPAELRKGSLYFVRRTDRTEVRLIIESTDGRMREESATMVGR